MPYVSPKTAVQYAVCSTPLQLSGGAAGDRTEMASGCNNALPFRVTDISLFQTPYQGKIQIREFNLVPWPGPAELQSRYSFFFLDSEFFRLASFSLSLSLDNSIK